MIRVRRFVLVVWTAVSWNVPSKEVATVPSELSTLADPRVPQKPPESRRPEVRETTLRVGHTETSQRENTRQPGHSGDLEERKGEVQVPAR